MFCIALDLLAQEPLNKPRAAASWAGKMQKKRPHHTEGTCHFSVRYGEKGSLTHCLAHAWKGCSLPSGQKAREILLSGSSARQEPFKSKFLPLLFMTAVSFSVVLESQALSLPCNCIVGWQCDLSLPVSGTSFCCHKAKIK